MPEKRKRRAPSDKSNHTHAVSAEERGGLPLSLSLLCAVRGVTAEGREVCKKKKSYDKVEIYPYTHIAMHHLSAHGRRERRAH